MKKIIKEILKQEKIKLSIGKEIYINKRTKKLWFYMAQGNRRVSSVCSDCVVYLQDAEGKSKTIDSDNFEKNYEKY